jgi:tetratricopeptide (TPR) repeat protein
LEKCIADDPDHVLAHKELAFILKNTGDVKGAFPYRLKVKELDPSDDVNRFNLAGLYAMLGKLDDALKELEVLLKKEPGNTMYQKL